MLFSTDFIEDVYCEIVNMSKFEALPFNVKFKMEVTNYSQNVLIPSGSYCESGHISSPPMAIIPGKTGEIMGHKMAFCATGACGVVSWDVEGINSKLAVMYSCPYNFDLYSNWLAVGMFDVGVYTDKKLFQRMYYDEGKYFINPLSANFLL